MTTQPPKCKAIMPFGDDFGDNNCTFHCQLQKGHDGQHQETGVLQGVPYKIVWGRRASHSDAKSAEKVLDDLIEKFDEMDDDRFLNYMKELRQKEKE